MIKQLKRWIKICIRRYKDIVSGDYGKFCGKDIPLTQLDYILQYKQEVKPSETFANKVYNLEQASIRINQYILKPNEIFSFWNVIGNPSHVFKSSRSIMNGQVKNEIGGGICQVSGLIYFAAIHARLDVLERHNHSLDLYTEETRFAPLGSDATVVYGYKDLRIRNPFNFPIKFHLELQEEGQKIIIQLQSASKIEEHIPIFERVEYEDTREVKVSYADSTLVNYSRYGKMK